MLSASNTPSSVILHARQLCKQVRLGTTILDILNGLDIEVKQGESVAILGTSGSGKSTLLGLLASLDSEYQGSIHLNGQNLAELSEDQRAHLRSLHVSFVFQSFQLLPALTALENVSLPLELKKNKQPAHQATRLLTEVGLAERLHHYPRQLSGGEQQRVAIARAFASEPSILFADEPTGNLDPKTGQHIVELLFRLNRDRNTTLILVTHDASLAERCGRRLLLQNGRLEHYN